MKKMVKIKEGDIIPPNAKYVSTTTEIEHGTPRCEWRPSPGFWGSVPIFGRETLYEITPRYQVTYHYYEVEVVNENS